MNITTKKNKLPLRRCLVTGAQLPKTALLRMVRTPQATLVVDQTGKLNGRGAYIQKDPALIPLLVKGKFIQKEFGVEPSPEFLEDLRKAMHG